MDVGSAEDCTVSERLLHRCSRLEMALFAPSVPGCWSWVFPLQVGLMWWNGRRIASEGRVTLKVGGVKTQSAVSLYKNRPPTPVQVSLQCFGGSWVARSGAGGYPKRLGT